MTDDQGRTALEPQTAVYDACVLYPAPLRDLLMWLAVTDLVKGRWTDRIHDEWTRNLLAHRPDLTADRVRRTRRLMDENVRGALVTGYEAGIARVDLPDPDDRHVLAAAVHCRADVIVTFNLSDFPAAALTPLGVSAVHPDDLVSGLFDAAPDRVCQAVRKQRATLTRPPVTTGELLDTFAAQRLPRTVSRLGSVAHSLWGGAGRWDRARPSGGGRRGGHRSADAIGRRERIATSSHDRRIVPGCRVAAGDTAAAAGPEAG